MCVCVCVCVCVCIKLQALVHDILPPLGKVPESDAARSVCVCVCVCVRARACVYMCTRARVSERERV